MPHLDVMLMSDLLITMHAGFVRRHRVKSDYRLFELNRDAVTAW